MNPLPGVPLTPDGRFHLFGAEHPLQKASKGFLLRAASATLFTEALVVSALSLAFVSRAAPPPLPSVADDCNCGRKFVMPPAPHVVSGTGGVKIADPHAGGRSAANPFVRPMPVEDFLAQMPTIASMDEALLPFDPDAIEGAGDGIFGAAGLQTTIPDSVLGRIGSASDEPFDRAEVMPVPVRLVEPDYPRIAVDAGVEGTVFVRAWVGADGLVKETRVLRGPDVLRAAAASAVSRWVFTPAQNGGRPVAVWAVVPVGFSLRD